MSTTNFPQNDAMAVKLWARVLETEALKYTAIRPLIGTDENSIIHLQNALSKGPGDQITYAIVMQLAQAGFTENQLAEGNGEALTTYSDALVINELMGGCATGTPSATRSSSSTRFAATRLKPTSAIPG
jgi:hypothetical protein